MCVCETTIVKHVRARLLSPKYKYHNIILLLLMIFIIRRLLYARPILVSYYIRRAYARRAFNAKTPSGPCPWTKRRAMLIRILITKNVSNHTGPMKYEYTTDRRPPGSTNMINNNRYHLRLMIINEKEENVSICSRDNVRYL